MAEYDIRPGMRRHRTLSYTKVDGSPGVVQDPPSWDMNDRLLAQVDVDADNMHGTIAHNGATGDMVLTSVADGDIGLDGEHRIVITDTFHMLAPLGAEGGSSAVGDEEPIP